MASSIFGSPMPRTLHQPAAIREQGKASAPDASASAPPRDAASSPADSVTISSAARIVAAIAKRTALLTASDGSPEDVPAVHPVLNGDAALQRGRDMLSGLRR
ncbi:MAG: hypothetical protein ACRDHX_05175 [Chloroflexota bacterium]